MSAKNDADAGLLCVCRFLIKLNPEEQKNSGIFGVAEETFLRVSAS
jgi:hypothetical protein